MHHGYHLVTGINDMLKAGVPQDVVHRNPCLVRDLLNDGPRLLCSERVTVS